MKEVFKKINGFKYYLISNSGKVKRISKNGREYLLKDRIIKRNSNRFLLYNRVVLYDSGTPKQFLIHRLVAIHFVSGYKKKLQVNHIDGNSLNNLYTNLEWVTASKNIQHSFKNLKRNTSHCAAILNKNRFKHPNPKLTKNQISEIRQKYVPYCYSLNRLASEYKVSKKLILLITQNKVYKNESN